MFFSSGLAEAIAIGHLYRDLREHKLYVLRKAADNPLLVGLIAENVNEPHIESRSTRSVASCWARCFP